MVILNDAQLLARRADC